MRCKHASKGQILQCSFYSAPMNDTLHETVTKTTSLYDIIDITWSKTLLFQVNIKLDPTSWRWDHPLRLIRFWRIAPSCDVNVAPSGSTMDIRLFERSLSSRRTCPCQEASALPRVSWAGETLAARCVYMYNIYIYIHMYVYIYIYVHMYILCMYDSV